METKERYIMPDGLGIGEYKPATLPAGPPKKPPTTLPAPARSDDDGKS